MNNTTKSCNDENQARFTLPPMMTIETAEALCAELKQIPLIGKTGLILDASEVEHITTPGLQLIVALEKTLSTQGGALSITNKKDWFIRALQDAGLENTARDVPSKQEKPNA